MAVPVATTTGLTAAEVAERVADGRINVLPRSPGRTVGQIVRANVLTPVNAIVGFMLLLIVIADGIGPDMLFGFVIVANSVIGSVQELRTRAALDRLAVLNVPKVVAVRDGVVTEIPLEEVVADDLLELGSGGQVAVDGTIVSSARLELNESLLTGEIDPVPKEGGDEVLSGSFVSAGSGTYRATRIGADSYAAQLANEAKQFTLVRSELRTGINKILKFLMIALPPIALLLFLRLLHANSFEGGKDWRGALSGTVAAGVAMVPDGLVLLTSVAFMAGVLKLARRNALLKELASVELLARVDTLCLDKTGTITTGEIVVVGVVPVGGDGADGAERVLAAFVASDPDPNATLTAIVTAYPDDPGWVVTDAVPFSSARKWSAFQFASSGPESTGSESKNELASHPAVFLGAPELLAGGDPNVTERVRAEASQGRRVVAVAAAASVTGEQLPTDLVPLALVLMEDTIRPDAEETLTYLSSQDIALKVISGDNPATVAAIAARAGVPDVGEPFDARDLPDDIDGLADAIAAHTVFGRVTPQQKREMVKALQSRDAVVGMTGDGVNDVLALKDADMGIAMGAGSAASRAVAQLVLLDNKFSVLPGVLAEGRRVINSVERAANLFIYGTVYSVCMALTIAIVGTDYPFLPRHLTLVRSLSVGIPGFFLALAPDPRNIRSGFLHRVIRFAIPAGIIAAAAALTTYLVTRSFDDSTLREARSAATVCLLGVGLGILIRLTGSLPPWRWILVGAMAGAVAIVLVTPALSAFFDLEYPPASSWWVLLGCVAAANVAIRFVPVTADEE